MPQTLSNCSQIEEFNVEGNDITQLPVSVHSNFTIYLELHPELCIDMYQPNNQ